MNESITAENEKQKRQKPPLSVGRTARELLSGMGLSFAIMTLVGFLEVTAFFGGIGNGADNRTTFASMVSKFIPAVSGIAGAVGVYLADTRRNYETGASGPWL